MSLHSLIYNAIFKRTSTFVVAMVGGAFFFERTLDIATDTIFETYNKGKLWKDIKSKYEKNE